jgi:hypothetical protein
MGKKREACLKALEIVDTRFADFEWTLNGKPTKTDKQGTIPTSEIRSCYNKLILACKDSKVPDAFAKCLNLSVNNAKPQPLALEEMQILRNAIRNELNLGDDLSPEIYWIFYINWNQ